MPGTHPQTLPRLVLLARRQWCTVACCAVFAVLASGCAKPVATPSVALASVEAEENAGGVSVPANRGWTDTGVEISAGEAITIEADGTVTFRKPPLLRDRNPIQCGPAGTFLYGDDIVERKFPLSSAASGPAPPYCLIGRIGDGPVFYVGARKSFTADRNGTLYLGINDFNLADNKGRFIARINRMPETQPVAYETAVDHVPTTGRPQKDASVVIFYIDGLRPDVVREMVAMGHLPTIRKLFVDGGTWVENVFTVFPSDTITSNGTMWTGCFSDRHGLKGQLRFSRRTLYSESYLEPMGPNRSSHVLAPQGTDRVLHQWQKSGIGLLEGKKAAEQWDRTYVSGVSPLYQRLQKRGSDWATGVLPVMTEVPPVLWTRSLVHHMPYFQAHKAWQSVDEANADYTIRHLVSRKAPVTIVWLPETDTASHKLSRGQFGLTRRTIAQADRLIAEIVAEFAAQKRLENTYFLLISDHGHHGGRNSHLSKFDIGNELFFQPRQRTKTGEWVGGGLGLSVRMHRLWNRHPDDASQEFVFLDADSDGAARIFLPRGHFRSGQWMGEAKPADLLQYRIAENVPPVNLVRYLTGWKSRDGQGIVERPVDLVLMKLAKNRVLISTHDRGDAVIDRRRNSQDRWEYRYRVVANVRPADDGTVEFDAVRSPRVDPLGVLSTGIDTSRFYDEQFWLHVTTRTAYPDGVVAFARHMLWDDNLVYREQEYAPDLVVTAKRGWYFGTQSSPGTMHGYPFFETMRATMFVAGPNIHSGARLKRPCRMVDLTPTVLEMIGHDFDATDFDGQPIRGIYRSGNPVEADLVQRPLFWKDVDLHAWHPLNYQPTKRDPNLPGSVNDPSSPFDLNNMLYNVLSISDLNVLRLTDDLLFPFRGQRKGLTEGIQSVENTVARSGARWAADGVRAMNVSGVSLADYSATSSGNLKRVDNTIDLMQESGKKLEQKIGKPLPGSRVTHTGIDTAQKAFWELYRFSQRLIAQVLDETIVNSLENNTDRAINLFRRVPAEVVVPSTAKP